MNKILTLIAITSISFLVIFLLSIMLIPLDEIIVLIGSKNFFFNIVGVSFFAGMGFFFFLALWSSK